MGVSFPPSLSPQPSPAGLNAFPGASASAAPPPAYPSLPQASMDASAGLGAFPPASDTLSLSTPPLAGASLPPAGPDLSGLATPSPVGSAAPPPPDASANGLAGLSAGSNPASALLPGQQLDVQA